MITDYLIALAEAYSAHTGLKLSSISTYVGNDGKWLGTLRDGTAGCTVRRATRAIQWFDAHWPADLEWPRPVPRPAKPSKPREAA